MQHGQSRQCPAKCRRKADSSEGGTAVGSNRSLESSGARGGHKKHPPLLQNASHIFTSQVKETTAWLPLVFAIDIKSTDASRRLSGTFLGQNLLQLSKHFGSSNASKRPGLHVRAVLAARLLLLFLLMSMVFFLF